MDLPGCANRSPTAWSLDSGLSNGLMHGFDVNNDGDEEYLAEVVTSRIGSTEDIQSFVHLSLLRSMEAWDQAICCACAMRDQEYCHNSLDGQDVLAFLSKLCAVNGSYHANIALCPPQRSKRLRTRRASERKKQRKAKRKRDSPYWNEMHVSPVQQDGCSIEDIQSDITAKQLSRKRRKLLGEVIQPTALISEEYGTSTRACKSSTHKTEDDSDNDGTREALSELNASPTKVPNATDATFESTSDGEQNTEKAQNLEEESEDPKKPPKARQDQTPTRKVAKSPYFEGPKPAATPTDSLSSKSPRKRPPRGIVSCLPFPRLDAPRFGLIQEELATDPFRLLVAVTFLVRTSGKAAIPVFRELMEEYPTPSALASASAADIEAKIKHLGLGHVRAATIQRFARLWMENPPRKGVRYAVKNYQGQSADYLKEEGDGDNYCVEDGKEMQWEIGHMTQGPYALDSWRIFCRDVLRGEAEDWNGGGREGEFQPEWMRVLPKDKELRACLRWMWMREGFQWDPDTGDKVVLSDELRRAVQEGRVEYEYDTGDLKILDE
ncbi:DNA glycosylase [Xylaria bambusicola]|uniref:DNA glycosylase n=1 Tax=Xylaria bambusicola TaxID=326684 RepID=UPI002007CC2B|nr:DNA glycosylase [Xylaria bambusicola]KAI0526064.1 DNA glycosylase [Xylaria bambusicola]